MTGGAVTDIQNSGPHTAANARLIASTRTTDGLGWYGSGYDLEGKAMGLTMEVLCLKAR